MHNMLIILHSSIGNRNLFLKMHKLWFKMHNRSLKNLLEICPDKKYNELTVVCVCVCTFVCVL